MSEAFRSQVPQNSLSFTSHKLFYPKYANVDYKKATEVIINKAIRHQSYGVSALAVHGLIESIDNKQMRSAVQRLDMITADGQPIRWALNYFHGIGLKSRTTGPELTSHVLSEANQKGLRVYLYGSTPDTLHKLQNHIERKYPNLTISGVHPDRFREATAAEDAEDIEKINQSESHIVLVGRGCPRQEIWVANHLGKINSVMMAVGAAFDFHAGTVKKAPDWMGNMGLEWLYRLIQEPRRLAKRYAYTNTKFIFLCTAKAIRQLIPKPKGT